MTHPDDQCCMSKRQSGQLTTMPLVTLRDGAVEAARLRDLLDHHITRSTPLGGLGVFEIRGVGARGQALAMPVGHVFALCEVGTLAYMRPVRQIRVLGTAVEQVAAQRLTLRRSTEPPADVKTRAVLVLAHEDL